MNRKIAIAIVLACLVTILAACTGPAAATEPKPAPPAQSTPPANLPAATQPPPTAATATVPKPAGPIKARELTPTVSNDTVSIPVKDVQNNWNTHFLVSAPGGTMGFMAYVLNDGIHVRASVCPPCRGKTYTLDGNTLVCDVCATTFKADTGIGIAGACVNYPKAAVAYETIDGNLVMKISDLSVAYQNTLKAGLP